MTMISVHPRAFYIPFHVGERCSVVLRVTSRYLMAMATGTNPPGPASTLAGPAQTSSRRLALHGTAGFHPNPPTAYAALL